MGQKRQINIGIHRKNLILQLFKMYIQQTAFVLFALLPFKIIASASDLSSSPLTETLHEIGFSQSLTVNGGPIVEQKSKYQDILVYQTPHFGKVLVLDDVVQLTERDAASYNEMMAHIPMMEHPNPKRVLVIGGGDGYVLHEILKHKSVLEVDHVDLDGEVVDVCKKHFAWGKAWDDERVTLHIANGASFVKDVTDDYYDVIVQDSSDPFTIDENGVPIDLPSGVLYSTEHFSHIKRILSKDGVFNFQVCISFI